MRQSTCRWMSILQLFKCPEDNFLSKWDITQDAYGNITIKTQYTSSSILISWVGDEITGLHWQCQFRGDWSQQMAILSSESDSSTLARRRGAICHTIFQSHYRHESRLSEFTSAYGATIQQLCSRGACPLLFLFAYWLLSVDFFLSSVNGYSEGSWPLANVRYITL